MEKYLSTTDLTAQLVGVDLNIKHLNVTPQVKKLLQLQLL